jgi:3-hydroxy acid dehydrogenase / malonic semialdehyde reductase
VQKKDEVFQNLGHLPDEWKDIDVLVNNAGLALGRDTIDEGSIADWETMIDTNMKGLLYVTKVIVQRMVERKHGHIINLGHHKPWISCRERSLSKRKCLLRQQICRGCHQ